MKKIILFLFVFISIINVSFANDKLPNKSFYGSVEKNLTLKDLKLITLKQTKTVDLKLFEQKKIMMIKNIRNLRKMLKRIIIIYI